jgi:tetratricopeptide (TPR) repeat protein
MTADLESTLIADMVAGKQVELERALLVVSGADTEEKIAEYKQKLDSIVDGFGKYKAEMDDAAELVCRILQAHSERPDFPLTSTAEALHNYLWQSKSIAHIPDFRLTAVIDSQLDDSSNKRVGDCFSLTSLYTVLGLRLGLDLSVLLFRDMSASDQGSHISNLWRESKDTGVPIENTMPEGFGVSPKDYALGSTGLRIMTIETPYTLIPKIFGKRGNAKKREKDYPGAIADYDIEIKLDPTSLMAYDNRGNAKADLGDYPSAIADYNRVIEMYPNCSIVYHNRGNSKFRMKDAGAAADYTKVIELEPDNSRAYCNRGAAKTDLLNDFTGAISDLDKAIELNPNHAMPFCNRGEAKEKSGDYAGAIADYTKSLEIDPDYNSGLIMEKLTSLNTMLNAGA